MIAIARPCAPATPHDQFLAMLPQIRESARFAFRKSPPDVREELIAEVVANAYCAFANLVRQGRGNLAYATPLAKYAIRQVRGGRRVGTRLNKKDITSPAAPAGRGITIERLDRFDEQRQEWREVLVEDKKAARRKRRQLGSTSQHGCDGSAGATDGSPRRWLAANPRRRLPSCFSSRRPASARCGES
jgi:hypothetical protein